MLVRLKNWATQLSGTDLPPLITDLSGQYSGYTGVQPCFDSLLYQMQHINETVIALPPAMQVCMEADLSGSPYMAGHGMSLHTTLLGVKQLHIMLQPYVWACLMTCHSACLCTGMHASLFVHNLLFWA